MKAVLSGTEDTYILVLRTHAADLVALGTHILVLTGEVVQLAADVTVD